MRDVPFFDDQDAEDLEQIWQEEQQLPRDDGFDSDDDEDEDDELR